MSFLYIYAPYKFTLTSTSTFDIGICDICFVCVCPAAGGGGSGQWCPFTWVSGYNACFTRVTSKVPWDSMLDACNQLSPDAHLVVINDFTKQMAVQNFLQGQHTSCQLPESRVQWSCVRFNTSQNTTRSVSRKQSPPLNFVQYFYLSQDYFREILSICCQFIPITSLPV